MYSNMLNTCYWSSGGGGGELRSKCEILFVARQFLLLVGRHLKIGGPNNCCVCEHTTARGSRGMLPYEIRCSEITSSVSLLVSGGTTGTINAVWE